jgi:hypothetical protein
MNMLKYIISILSLLMVSVFLSSCSNYSLVDLIELRNQTIEAGSEDVDWSTKIIGDISNIVTMTELEDNVDYNTPGEYTIIVLIVDSKGNEVELASTITVIDTSKPSFRIDDYTVEAGTEDVDWTLRVNDLTDNSDTQLSIVEVDGVDYDTPGEYKVVIIVSDEFDNIATEIATITVIDTTAPTFEIDDQVIKAGLYNSLESFIKNINENSDGELIYSENNTSIEYDKHGVYTAEIVLTDESGNQASQEVIITVLEPLIDLLLQESFTISPIKVETYNALYSDYNIQFDAVYYVDNYDSVRGTIFEVNNQVDLENLFTLVSDESFLENEIIFVYKLEHYVLVMNHPTDSIFPDLIELYNFSNNYQYDYFYKNDVIHPLIEYLMSTSDSFEDSTGHLIDPETGAYFGTDVFMRSLNTFENEWYGGYIIELDNMDDTMTIYEMEINNTISYGCCTVTTIQYQNIVLRITAQRYYEYLIFENLPEGLEYIVHNPVIFD